MREAIGGTFLFNIVILFILLFTGIMSVTINRSNAFTVKDEIINLIERDRGVIMSNTLTGTTGEEIVDIMAQASYRSTGTCPDGYRGYNRDGNLVTTADEAAICIRGQQTGFAISDPEEDEIFCYYSVVLFYSLDIPLIRSVFRFSVVGETKSLTGSRCN